MVLRLGAVPDSVWVLATLNPDYLLDRQSRYSQTATDQFQMVRLDGSVLVSTQDHPVGAAFAQPALLSRIQREELGTDAGDWLTAFRSSSRYPLFVTVSIDRQAILAQWAHRSWVLLASTVAALLAVVWITLLLMRRIHTGERADRLQHRTIRKLSQAMEQNPIGILIIDAQGLVEYCNPFFCALSGYSASEIVGRQPYLLDAGHTPAQTFKDLRATLRAGNVWSGEFIQRHRDGHEFAVYAVLAPLRDEAGRVTHYIGTEHDISAQKQLQSDLESSRDRAEAATRAKSEFLANMSHEIRTPMNGVIGMTDLALDTELDTKQRRYLDTVKSSAQALLVVLNDILDFSKIEAGKLEIEQVPFSLARVVEDTCAAIEVRAAKAGLTLVWDLPATLPVTMQGDPGRIRQVFSNLLDNAVKFTPQGRITLRVSATPDGTDGYMLACAVSDTGVGIALAKQAHIFSAFSQADSSTTRRYGGTGLGLTICGRLVELMGGRLWVESVPGSGSTFHFTVRLGPTAESSPLYPIPAHAPTPTDDLPSAQIAPSRSRSLRVLLVEDHAINQLLATALLKKWGHTVVLAENGQQALDLFASSSWDAILMDVQMPVMGGLEATGLIRQREAAGTTRVPIIAVTANAMESDRQACMAAGMDAFLPKPLNAANLQALLVQYCP
jgi:PAS domain S-box-containing protein